MAGRDLKALLAAYRDRDDLSFRRAAQAIIEEEESKRHTALARDLRRLLASGSGFHTPAEAIALPESPRNRETDIPLVDFAQPVRGLGSLVLTPQLEAALEEIVKEVALQHQLDAASIPRRRSLLLYGPPGCGKTSIAEAIAGELSRTLAVVKTEAVMSSYLGETAANISRVFDVARSGPFVLLFDEFDSLGKSRDDPSDHGELRRVVNTVLQLIDRYEGPSLIIAATNHDNVLDPALWRRFAEVLAVPLPDADARRTVLLRILLGRTEGDVDFDGAVDLLDGLPHAAVERAGFDALRLSILAGRTAANSADLIESTRRTLNRRWL